VSPTPYPRIEPNRMLIEPFDIRPLNRHYEGGYSETELRWRRLGAKDKANNLQRLLGTRSVGTVLEVGCGTGAVLAEVARRGIGTEHVGIDLADPTRHTDPAAVGLDLRRYDGFRLPFPDASFDMVFASHVVEHVPNPRSFLAELKRVSSKLVFVEVPCEIGLPRNRRTFQAALNTGHINAFTPEHFLVLLQTSGFDVIDLQLFDHSWEVHAFDANRLLARLKMTVRRALLRLSPLLASRLFCYHCAALLRLQVHAADGQRDTSK
jgi:SAM-dependent methyltransferase